MSRQARIAVTAMGSEGDVRPFVALAVALRARGHDACVVAADRFRARADGVGVPFRSTGQKWDEARYRAAMTSVIAEQSPLRQIRSLVEAGANELAEAAPGVVEATRDAELIVHHAGDVNGFAASLVHQRPRMTATLAPGILPGGFVAWIGRLMVPSMTDAPFNRVLAAAGVAPRKKIVLETAESSLLNLVAISPQILAPHRAWAGRFEATGYWFLDEPSFEPDPALRAFVENGEPPFVITFGSMMDLDARILERIDAMADAVRRSGRRAVIQAPEGMGTSSAEVFLTGYAPHGWLFPRCAGVVHHGGAGTCAAALRAGVPQSIVWVFGDQPDWGKRLHARGVAAAPMSMSALSSEALLERLRAMDAAMHERARGVASALRSEDGLARACDLIEARMPAQPRSI